MASVTRALIAAVLIAAALVAPVGSGDGGAAAQSEIDPQRPSRHFRIERPAGLSGADALVIYNRILDDLVAGYRLSSLPYADSHRSWRRFNTVPYRSAQHGERYVSNYANDIARGYRRFEQSGELPVGSILVKDSFAVTRQGDVFSGPLFVMEKMPPGFRPAGGDWRYTMVMPDGSLFGSTGAAGAERVEFCAGCHERVGDGQDHLFYVPKQYRVRFLD